MKLLRGTSRAAPSAGAAFRAGSSLRWAAWVLVLLLLVAQRSRPSAPQPRGSAPRPLRKALPFSRPTGGLSAPGGARILRPGGEDHRIPRSFWRRRGGVATNASKARSCFSEGGFFCLPCACRCPFRLLGLCAYGLLLGSCRDWSVVGRDRRPAQGLLCFGFLRDKRGSG